MVNIERNYPFEQVDGEDETSILFPGIEDDLKLQRILKSLDLPDNVVVGRNEDTDEITHLEGPTDIITSLKAEASNRFNIQPSYYYKSI